MDANSIELKIFTIDGETYLIIRPMNKNNFNSIHIDRELNRLKLCQRYTTNWGATTRGNLLFLNNFLKDIEKWI